MANITLDFVSERLFLIAGPADLAQPVMNEIIARCAAAGPVMVLDGANAFDPYTVARLLRGQNADVDQALNHIQVSRAFTCYQLLSLLAKTPVDTTPKILLNPLAQFRDEHTRTAERMRIFGACIDHLRQISRAAPTLISACLPAAGDPVAGKMFAALQAAADSVLYLKTPPPTPAPPRML